MPRRPRRDVGGLSGGTGDLNPQWFSTSAVESANDTTTTTAVSTPPGIGLSQSGKPLAMEILKVMVNFEQNNSPGKTWDGTAATYAPGATSENMSDVRLIISSKNFGTTYPALSMGDATVVAFLRESLRIYESTAASTLATIDEGPLVLDMTDGAGHGVLYANQNMYLQVSSTVTNNIIAARVKILYREKYISQAELLGLVLQSNQN